jgi:hypothetical protein
LAQPPLGLLRRHVRRRAQHLALHRRLHRAARGGLHRGGLAVRLADDLGQAPVEDDHFAVVAQHHVLRFQVAVQHAARVRVRHRVARPDKGGQQLAQLQRPRLAAAAALVVGAGGLGQGAAADEAHGVERRLVVGPPADLVDGHDAGVLQLARHLRLAQEARPQRRLAGPLGAQFLQRHVTAQAGVTGQPDAADAAGGVQPRQRVALAGLGDVGGGGQQDVPLRRRGGPGQRLPHVFRHARQRLPDRVRGDLGQAGFHVAAVFLQLALQ